MKKFLSSLFVVLLILGIAGTATSFSDAIAALKNETVELNSSSKEDFSKNKLINGEVYYVYDCIATEEVSRTTYGVKTGTTETNFYLIESYNKDWWSDETSEYEPLTLVYSTSNKDEIKQLDKLAEEWASFDESYYNWYNDEEATEEDFPEPPTGTFELTGKICKYSDDKIVQYRDEYIGEYVSEDVDSYVDKYCADMMIQRIDTNTSKILFFGAIGVAIIGLIGLIAVACSGKKKKSEELD